jgi:hypothetical protein
MNQKVVLYCIHSEFETTYRETLAIAANQCVLGPAICWSLALLSIGNLCAAAQKKYSGDNFRSPAASCGYIERLAPQSDLRGGTHRGDRGANQCRKAMT